VPGWTKKPGDRDRDSQRYGADWRRKRLECLKRAKWRCEIKIEGICIIAATQVDHIRGAENDPNHLFLRAACEPCHKHVTSRQGHAARKPANPAPRPRTKW
jgi:5-methylcytosine-specific restriction endonuclease McrA